MLTMILAFILLVAVVGASVLTTILVRRFQQLRYEYTTILQLQHGIIFKFKKIGDRFVYTMANGKLIYEFGLTQADVGKTMEEIMPATMHAFTREAYERAWKGECFQYESGFRGFTYLNSVTPILVNGVTVEVLVIGSDITDRKKAEQEKSDSERRYRYLIELSPDAIIVLSGGRLILANQRAVRMMRAKSFEDLAARPVIELVHPDYRARARDQLAHLHERNEALHSIESKCIRMDGQVIDVEATAAAIKHRDHVEAVVIVRDITERKIADQQIKETNLLLAKLANLDGLTEIANRRFWDEMIQKEWSLAAHGGQPLSLILCDIDHFKAFNDTYGHQEGDRCLKLVADALDRAAYPNRGFVARYGGEEFVVLLPETFEAVAVQLARQLRQSVQALAVPHIASKTDDCVTISLGVVTMYPSLDVSQEVLVRNADKALYAAKSNGRNQVQVFSELVLEAKLESFTVEV